MLRTGREEAANMVPEPECRNVAIPGLRPSQRQDRQKLHRVSAKQGGTASIFVALEFSRAAFIFAG